MVEREFQLLLHNLPITVILSPFGFFTKEYYLTEGAKKNGHLLIFLAIDETMQIFCSMS